MINGKFQRVIKLLILIVIITLFIVGVKIYNHNEIESIGGTKDIHQDYMVALTADNCKITEQSNTTTIEKYNGNATTVVINKDIVLGDTVQIEQTAFEESRNLETILIEKSIFSEGQEIDNFEINNDYEDDKYIQYKTTKQYSESYNDYLELSDEEKSEVAIVPAKYDVGISSLNSTTMEKNYKVSSISTDDIPKSFDLRDKIDIKVESQGDTGICYSFASLTSVETNLALINNEYIDLSEVHQSFLTYGSYGSFISANDSYYSNKIGPVYESEWPMEKILGKEKDEMTEKIYQYLKDINADSAMNREKIQEIKELLKQTKAKKHITETVNFPSIDKNKNIYTEKEINDMRDVIKTHIMNYGSVYAGISSKDIADKGNIQVLNSDGLYNIDHAVSIIGWDDNFGKENFPLYCKPETDGAYLALNSLGEEWGENGCFWISYEDQWAEMYLSGVISVEDVQEKISVNTVKVKDVDTNEEILEDEIVKGKNVQVDINLDVNEPQNSEGEFTVSIISPSGENIANKVIISKNEIVNNIGQIRLDLNTKILDVGTYTINLEYDNEVITTQIQINNNIFDYQIKEDGTITIKSYHGNEKDIIVPEEFLGYKVTGIASDAFTGSDINSITVNENVIQIGENIINKSTIIYGQRGTYIEEYAIKNGYTFVDLNENKIEGEGWYYNTDEKKLYILENLDEMPYQYLSNVIYKVEIANSVDKILANQFKNYINLREVILPSTITSIGQYAFSNCKKLQSVNIPNEVTSIGRNAFANCKKLASIEIPEELTRIEINTFAGCESLSNVKIPQKVTSIGDYAFCYCYELETIEIPSSVTSIGMCAFSYCEKIKNIILPEGLSSIGTYVFYYCTGLEAIEIPVGVKEIKDYTFYGCTNLQSIIIPEKVTGIGSYAFCNCSSLENIEIPVGVKEIKDYTFYKCTSLKNIELPEGLTSIGKFAFRKCNNIWNIEIPQGVTTIGESAFEQCCINTVIEGVTKTIQEIDMSNMIKRVIDEKDILYCNVDNIITSNASLNLENKKIVIDANGYNIKLDIREGLLKGLSFVFVIPSGSITYSETEWTTDDIIAILHTDKEKIKHTFKENGEFKFEYLDENEEKKTAIAKVENIDREVSTEGIIIMKLVDNMGNEYENDTWTNQNVYLKINDGEDKQSGHKSTTYTINGEEQTSVEQILSETGIYNIVVTTTDNLGNVATKLYTVKIRREESIHLTEKPEKLNYNAYENFDRKGMKISIKYDNGDIEEITDYTIVNGENLTCKNKEIEIRYNQNEELKFVLPISVSHAEVIDAKVEATCEEAGKTEGKHCAECEKVLVEQTIIPSKGHTEIIDAKIEATCEKAGKTEGKHCKECGKILVEQKRVEALGHNNVNGECTRCGEGLEINVTSTKYEVSGQYITKISPKTTARSLIEALETNATEIKIYTKKQDEVGENDFVGTGMIVTFKLKEQEKVLNLIIPGDTTGDGKIDFKDLVLINRHRLSKIKIQDEYLTAGDVTGDKKIDFKDLVKINQYRLNKITQL